MLLGLTGAYCAGKNAVASILESAGWTCIDVDKLGHEAMELAREPIVERFGGAALGPDGRLDRRAIARIVFSDPAALADQEAIVHPIAIRLTDERIAAAEAAAGASREPKVCMNAALLYRTPQAGRCDAILEVRAPLLLRLRRARLRDGLGAGRALQRMLRQASFWRLRSASGRPVIFLWNGGSRERLEAETRRALKEAFARAFAAPSAGRGS
jgi:dephospho-CoA kinase